MSSYIKLTIAFVLAIGAGCATARTAQAQDRGWAALREGSEWTLTVNDQSAPMKVVSVEVDRLATRGIILAAEIVWRDRPGVLKAVGEAGSRTVEVMLELAMRSDRSRDCSGVLSLAADMMAGFCGEGGAQGAWYATRITRVAGNDRGRPVRPNIQVPSSETRTTATRSSTRDTGQTIADGELPPLDKLSKSLSPWYENGGGSAHEDAKSDSQVGPLEFPRPPSSAGILGEWLTAHNRALLDVFDGLYPVSAVEAFLQAEATTCDGFGPYCLAAFRQKAIAVVVASQGR